VVMPVIVRPPAVTVAVAVAVVVWVRMNVQRGHA